MDITQESFDALLNWLDPDREVAAQKYETIRAGLIRIFVSKGCNDAEHLADKAIDIVIGHLPDLQDYVGEKAKYFIGVARYIIMEQQRPKEIATDEVPDQIVEDPPPSDAYECLIKCLSFLPKDQQELILEYYVHSGSSKIRHHRGMAAEFGITKGALRMRVHHIRSRLGVAVKECLKSLSKEQNRT